MGYRVKDAIEISIRINGREYPLSDVNTLNYLHIGASSKFLLPTLCFSVVDVTKSMGEMGLTDGSKIQVIISCDGQLVSRNFRVHSWSHPPGQDVYTVDAFWDAPKFRVGTSDKALRGTSDSVLSTIAAACGLEYDGCSTSDTQLWLPRNKTFADFVTYVTAHGYINERSHMVSAVTSRGVLKYRNARDVPKKFQGVYGYEAPRAYKIEEYVPSTKAGMNNALGGYRSVRIENSTGSDVPISHDKLEFQPDSKNLLVNASVRDEQERGVVSYAPIGFGNVHTNFQRARYQNARFDLLKSLSCEFLIFNPTVMEPLDELSFSTSATTPSDYDGLYVLSSKVIYIQGNTYVEKHIGLREGTS